MKAQRARLVRPARQVILASADIQSYLPNKSFVCEAGVRFAEGARTVRILGPPPWLGGTRLAKYLYCAVNADIKF